MATPCTRAPQQRPQQQQPCCSTFATPDAPLLLQQLPHTSSASPASSTVSCKFPASDLLSCKLRKLPARPCCCGGCLLGRVSLWHGAAARSCQLSACQVGISQLHTLHVVLLIHQLLAVLDQDLQDITDQHKKPTARQTSEEGHGRQASSCQQKAQHSCTTCMQHACHSVPVTAPMQHDNCGPSAQQRRYSAHLLCSATASLGCVSCKLCSRPNCTPLHQQWHTRPELAWACSCPSVAAHRNPKLKPQNRKL